MSWPHKDDGTVDWDFVFDDPEVGLTGFVARAGSLVALGQCAHVIIQSLFIRDGDQAYRKAFDHMVDEIISSSDPQDAEHARSMLLKLVYEVKANRVRHAQTYLDTVEAGGEAGGDERRGQGIDHAEALQALKEMSN